jgi:hypothetical protein
VARKFIQQAIKHPGALRATAKSRGLIKGKEPLSESDLDILAKSGDTTTKQRVALARRLKQFPRRKKGR